VRPVACLGVPAFREALDDGEPEEEGVTPFDVRRSSVRDALRGVDPALTTFFVDPETFLPPLDDPAETFRLPDDDVPPEVLRFDERPIPSPILAAGELCVADGEPVDVLGDLKIELLTRLLWRTCLKLELVLLGP
jgi:hypothetical protein